MYQAHQENKLFWSSRVRTRDGLGQKSTDSRDEGVWGRVRSWTPLKFLFLSVCTGEIYLLHLSLWPLGQRNRILTILQLSLEQEYKKKFSKDTCFGDRYPTWVFLQYVEISPYHLSTSRKVKLSEVKPQRAPYSEHI